MNGTWECNRDRQEGIRWGTRNIHNLAQVAYWQGATWAQIKHCLQLTLSCLDGLSGDTSKIKDKKNIYDSIRRAVGTIRDEAIDLCEDATSQADYTKILNCLYLATACLEGIGGSTSTKDPCGDDDKEVDDKTEGEGEETVEGDPDCMFPPCDDNTLGCRPICQRST